MRPEDTLRAAWRDLVGRRLPEAVRPDWPVRLDHCFARILLDNACGGPWRARVAPPAHANMPADRLEAAVALGEAVLAGTADLARLNRRSLAWRGKAPLPIPPQTLDGGDFRLRRWTGADTDPFTALNADPVVMAHFPAPRDARQSADEGGRLDRLFAADGFGPWVVEEDGRFLGFVGAMRLMRALPFPGGERPGEGVELAWRLARAGWGRGLATRAARLALDDLAVRCGVRAVVAFTAAGNARSRAVMERLGMRPDGTFAHPAVPEGPLRTHLLYRLDLDRQAVGAAA